MNQTKLLSAIEVLIDSITGFIVAMGVQSFIFPMYGMHPSHGVNFQLTCWFTVASMIRRYIIRRCFNGSLGAYVTNLLAKHIYKKIDPSVKVG